MSYALRLKEVRKNRGITQAKLADKVGVTRQTILQIEDGSTKSTSLTVKIAKALGADPTWLELGEGICDSNNVSLNKTEAEVVALFRQLNEEDKNSILRILSSLNSYTFQ